MSNPKNVLSSLHSYEPRHILLAFDNAEGACNYVVPNTSLGKCGSKLQNVKCGNGYVIVNELDDISYNITRLTWSYDFFSPTTPNTTVSAGSFTVADARGNQFPSFLRRMAKKLKIRESRITFYLMTVFRGRTAENDTSTNYVTNPLIFNMTDSATGFQEGMVNQFTFNFAFLYNTIAQLPNFSRLDQFTITNRENNPSRGVPTTSNVKGEIISRAKEDERSGINRAVRTGKSAPMRNLKEVFEGFEADLQEMRFENKRQLQEFIAVIRPDSVKRIKTPKAKRAKGGTGLPITFEVKLDPAYHNYPVDNRNLMTEQTETRQNTAGIRSLTVPPGSSVFSTVESIMKLSSKTGQDVADGYAFKIAMSSVTDGEGVAKNTINIRRYRIPRNQIGTKDTGPDKDGNVKTLELEYMNGGTGMDVMSLQFSSSPPSDVAVLEEDSDDLNDDALTTSSQREQITFERAADSGFGGLRVTSSSSNFGLQTAEKAALVDRLNHRYSLSQNTLTVVDIVGNPDLYSDLARNPLFVSDGRSLGAKLYKFPEYYPMYINLKVKISNAMTFGVSGDDEDFWYHTYHYHLSGVTNVIIAGQFVQTLRLLSTDDVT